MIDVATVWFSLEAYQQVDGCGALSALAVHWVYWARLVPLTHPHMRSSVFKMNCKLVVFVLMVTLIRGIDTPAADVTMTLSIKHAKL